MKTTLKEVEEWTGHRDPAIVRIARQVITGIILGALAIALSSCSLTVSPDGSRTYKTEPETFLRAIEVIAEK